MCPSPNAHIRGIETLRIDALSAFVSDLKRIPAVMKCQPGVSCQNIRVGNIGKGVCHGRSFLRRLSFVTFEAFARSDVFLPGWHERVDRIEILWPSGKTETLRDLQADHFFVVKGRGNCSSGTPNATPDIEALT